MFDVIIQWESNETRSLVISFLKLVTIYLYFLSSDDVVWNRKLQEFRTQTTTLDNSEPTLFV